MLPIMRFLCRTATAAALGVLLTVAALPALSASAPADPPADGASLQGKFLVANPSLPDPRFAHAVILLVKHDSGGAFGLVINRPVGIAEVTPDEPGAGKAEGETAPPPKEPAPIRFPAFLGGPVEPNKAFIVHSPEYKAEGTVRVTARVAITANAQILKDIADGKGPKRTLYVVGYSGWSPGQLEAEMQRNSWFQAPVDDGLIFSGEDTDAIWEQAMEMRLRGI
jgi:putative transcriptional regulator